MSINEDILDCFIHRFKKEKTKADYKRDILKFLEAINKDYLEVDFHDCRKYMDDIVNNMDEGKMAVATGEKLYSQLYSFFNYLEVNEYIDYNHFKKIEKPKASRYISDDKIITWEELDKIISILRTYKLRDYAALMLIFTSGLTLNEAVNLKWNQFIIDVKENVGIIFQTKDGERYVKVHKDTWSLLADYREKELRIVNADSYVFLNNRGERITGRWLRMVLKKACSEANTKKEYSPRNLRHTLAAHTLKMGASARKVKEQLGWSDSNLAKRYLYGIQQLENNAVDYLNFTLKKEPN